MSFESNFVENMIKDIETLSAGRPLVGEQPTGGDAKQKARPATKANKSLMDYFNEGLQKGLATKAAAEPPPNVFSWQSLESTIAGAGRGELTRPAPKAKATSWPASLKALADGGNQLAGLVLKQQGRSVHMKDWATFDEQHAAGQVDRLVHAFAKQVEETVALPTEERVSTIEALLPGLVSRLEKLGPS